MISSTSGLDRVSDVILPWQSHQVPSYRGTGLRQDRGRGFEVIPHVDFRV